SKALGVTVLDYDNDGWPDLFVANDTQPNKLYRNLKNGKFEDIGLTAGVAFDESGVARGAMGVDAADYDRSGRQHLVVGNFSNQMLSLFHNEGQSLFVDDAARAGVGRPSLLTLTFGAFFLDYDNDGYLDIFTANGHIDEEIERVQPKVTYAQRPQMYRNLAGKRFEDISAKLGAAFQKPMVARGAAYADFDLDGDLDILIVNNNGAPVLLRNDGGSQNNWLRVRTVGSSANRDGIGAVIKLTSASGTQTQTVRSGSSYCSQSELAVTFGLGKDATVTQLEIVWPGGEKQVIAKPPVRKAITIVQGKGIQ
ncbi:MAG: CRTAC1 family protein, partial [Bryobacterales bacterium]|nr:CRTAC1 family protein [Bryobacterales bacterium]